MVNRDKPGIEIWNYGVGYQLDYHYHSDFIKFFFNMVDFLDGGQGMTQGYDTVLLDHPLLLST